MGWVLTGLCKAVIEGAMIVARAFQYGSRPETALKPPKEKLLAAQTGSIGKEAVGQDLSKGPKLLGTGIVPPAAPSMPQIIPTRVEPSKGRTDSGSRVLSSRCFEYRNISHEVSKKRQPLTSLLAVTSIPTGQNASSHRYANDARKWKTQRNSSEGNEPFDCSNTLSSSSPQSWDLLQSPPENNETDNDILSSNGLTIPLSFCRSESASSLPSLDSGPGTPTTSSSPSTPGSSLNKRNRRQKSITSEICENGHHPLSQTRHDFKEHQASCTSDSDILEAVAMAQSLTTRSSFKSNLTASFRGIKTAAKSFSNYALPAFQLDDSLNRSIFSVPLKLSDERRPCLLDEAPDISLRRYLNPVHISASELCTHTDQAHLRRDRCTASIQLQTYYRDVQPMKHASSPPIFIPSGRSSFGEDLVVGNASAPRQREPRENSDFLRVIVLELNMRKAGKLSGAACGRARIWLPPRQSARTQDPHLGGVPRRWSGIVS